MRVTEIYIDGKRRGASGFINTRPIYLIVKAHEIDGAEYTIEDGYITKVERRSLNETTNKL